MSAPEPTGTRQRKVGGGDEDVKVENPSSLAGSSKNVARKKPVVKPPFADISLSRFLTYLVLGLVAIAAFYTWRLTVYAAKIGGYWNLITGHRENPVTTGFADTAAKMAGSAVSAHREAKATGKSGSAGSDSAVNKGRTRNNEQPEDVESQIFRLASALGVKPADLSAAIRPLIDPTAPNPAEKAKLEAEALKAQAASQDQNKQPDDPGLLKVVGEAFLD